MFVTIVILMIIFLTYIWVKIDNAYKNQKIILDAIYDYLSDEYKKSQCLRTDLVSFADMEELTTTLFRLWDWSYERILPPEKFKLVEPYINKKERGI